MPKADAKSITPGGPVECAARTYGQLERAYSRLDDRRAELREDLAAKLDCELSALLHRMDALKEDASWRSAGADIGAIFQLGIISEALDDIADTVPGSDEQRAAKARARRCLHSIRLLLAPRAGDDLAEISIDCMLPPAADEVAIVERLSAA